MKPTLRTGRHVVHGLLALFLVASLPACAQRHVVHHDHHRHGRVVVVKKGHVHSARCGHFRHNGAWYFVKGHVHGKACGHRVRHGVWIVD